MKIISVLSCVLDIERTSSRLIEQPFLPVSHQLIYIDREFVIWRDRCRKLTGFPKDRLIAFDLESVENQDVLLAGGAVTDLIKEQSIIFGPQFQIAYRSPENRRADVLNQSSFTNNLLQACFIGHAMQVRRDQNALPALFAAKNVPFNVTTLSNGRPSPHFVIP